MTRQEAAYILGVSLDASLKVLNHRWKLLARKYHPDLHPGDKRKEAKFRKVNEAYNLLRTITSSPAARDLARDVLDEEFSRWIKGLSPELQKKIQQELEALRNKS